MVLRIGHRRADRRLGSVGTQDPRFSERARNPFIPAGRTRPLSCHALPFRHPHRENDRGVLRRAGRNDRNAFRRTGTSGTRVGLPPARSGNPRTESYASRRERAKSPGQDILPEKRIPDNGTRRVRSARNQASDPPSVATRKPASERFGTK